MSIRIAPSAADMPTKATYCVGRARLLEVQTKRSKNHANRTRPAKIARHVTRNTMFSLMD